MKINTMRMIPYICLLTIGICGQAYAADNIAARPMIKVKLTQTELMNLCKSIQAKCADENIALWKLKNTENGHYYLIDSTPQIIRLMKVGSAYRILDQWNFKDYEHHNKSSDIDMGEAGLSIYPAFYPVNQQDYAIAVLNSWFTGYSGGGASEKYADFVVLKPQGKYAVAAKDIFFSSESMIRACFSAAEYETSPHCHDEEWSVMSIKFKDVGKAYYQWQLNYSHYSWDAFKPKNTTKVEKNQHILMPFER